MQAEQSNKRLVKFIVAALLFFAWGIIMGSLQAQKPIQSFPGIGLIVGAHVHINLLGWVSLSLAALIYYLAPVLSGKTIAAPGLINWIFWLWVIDLALVGIFMILAGIASGNAVIAGKGSQMDAILAPYMIPVSILSIICALIILTFIVQILVSIGRKAKI